MTLSRLLPLATLVLLVSITALAQENYNAGYGSGTGGAANVFVGPFAGGTTTGSANTFLGRNAGYLNTTGYQNSFLGCEAGLFNKTGSYNNFLGYRAGYSNTTGNYNTFLGYKNGFSNTTGIYNTFVGSSAGYLNTTGSNNSFMGVGAGYYNTTGTNNSFLGFQAGLFNTTGFQNSFIGSFAGVFNTTGYQNIFLGGNAGYSNTTGNYNNFMGIGAGYYNTLGSYNNFVGIRAGYYNTTGNSNSILGSYAGQSNTTGSDNSFVGTYAGYANTTGTYNSCLGRNAGLNNATGSFNVFVGSNTSSPSGKALANAGAIGAKAYVSASNALVLGAIKGTNGATANTNVGIGTSAPGYLLHVNGKAAKPGTSTWTVASDIRLKKNISTFNEGLDVLTKIKPVWFEYNGEAGMPTEKKYVGIIAQHMQKIAPYTVGEFTYSDSTGKQEKYLDYDSNALTYILVNSVKELKQDNTNQQMQLAQKDAQLSNQQQQINTLTNRLAQLEAALGKLTGEPPKVISTAAQLYQNAPNPTEGTTVIGYFLPKEVVSAQLKIYSVTGVEVQSIELEERGKGQVSVSVGKLAAGQYIYHLLVDGQSVASKKLLLNR